MASKTLVVLKGFEGEPVEPDWNDLYDNREDISTAREEWRKVVTEMREDQTLAFGNGHAISRLVHFRIIYRDALHRVTKQQEAVVVPGKNGPRMNPWFLAMRKAEESIRILEAELGISPLRRKKVGKVAKRETKTRAADSYLAKRA